MKKTQIEATDISGLLILDLGLEYNEDGWFAEAWHREKMTALGLPDFGPVQSNVTHVAARGTTRGFLAEPWDRLVSVVRGHALGAWVDLRQGPGFGRVLTHDLRPGVAVFVPRGVANAHQVLEDETTFTFLLEHHWTPQARRNAAVVDPFDPELGIIWPISRSEALVAHRDTLLPRLADAKPMPPRRTLVVGTETDLGRSLVAELPGAVGVTLAELAPDVEDPVDLSAFEVVVSAFGRTGAGNREWFEGANRSSARGENWQSAAARANRLADIARRHHLTYVHISTHCVFDRSLASHTEDEPISLAHSHGQALAAGEIVAMGVPRHLVVRTSRVIGQEGSYLAELATAARRGESAEVVANRFGRLTFASQLAAGIAHLLDSGAPSGTYNLTGDGPVVSWAEIARRVFELSDADPALVREVALPEPEGGVSTDSGVLDLERIKASDFHPGNAWLEIPEQVAPTRRRALRAEADAAVTDRAHPTTGQGGPYRVLFVCTANISRSAFADVVASGHAPAGVEFSSAGTQAVVGAGIDPAMAATLGPDGRGVEHRARQLTRELVEESDLVIAMDAEHRRYILDEWPTMGRKVYQIGQVAREMAALPSSVTLDSLTGHLWSNRSTQPGDGVADPYRKGPQVAREAARTISGHLRPILLGLGTLVEGRMERE